MVVCVTSPKGGVGKSTVTLYLAKYFAFKGYCVTLHSKDLHLVLGMKQTSLFPELHLTIRDSSEYGGLFEQLNLQRRPFALHVLDLNDPLEFLALEVLEKCHAVLVPYQRTALAIPSTLHFLSYLHELDVLEKTFLYLRGSTGKRKCSIPEELKSAIFQKTQVLPESFPLLKTFETVDLQPLSHVQYQQTDLSFSVLYNWLITNETH